MTEKAAVQRSLTERVGKVQMDLIWKSVMKGRKVVDSAKLTDDDGVAYDEVVHKVGDTEFVIRAKHVTIDAASEHGNSSCKDCWGKGYSTVEVAKSSLRNPSDHVVLSHKSLENLTDKECEIIIEEERKNPRWRILLPCHCAIKRMVKLDPNFFANDDRSILLRLEYEEKPCEVV